MRFDYSKADGLVRGALGKVFPAASVEIAHRGETVARAAYGFVDPEEGRRPVAPGTLFDMASVSKLFATTAFMTLVEEGRVGLDDRVMTVLGEFDGRRPIRAYEDPLNWSGTVKVVPETNQLVDAGEVSFRDLLCHRSGLPAWRPFFREPSPGAARKAALACFFSYPRGTRVLYSDVGLILLGMAIERLDGRPLDQAVAARVCAPLGMKETGYRRISAPPPEPASGIAPTEYCAWRGRRISGEVHDENAWGMDGVSGHAGVFSTARDALKLGLMYAAGGGSLLKRETVLEMRKVQSEEGAVRRGIGFALWSPDPEAASNPLSRSAFGHLGFTGTSLWIDPERELVVACLTDRVYYGRDPAGMTAFRAAFHRAVAEAADAAAADQAASSGR